MIKSSLTLFHIKPDYFVPLHGDIRDKYFEEGFNILDKLVVNHLCKKRRFKFFSSIHRKPIEGGFVLGTCLNCNDHNSGVYICESCGDVHSPDELIEPKVRYYDRWLISSCDGFFLKLDPKHQNSSYENLSFKHQMMLDYAQRKREMLLAECGVNGKRNFFSYTIGASVRISLILLISNYSLNLKQSEIIFLYGYDCLVPFGKGVSQIINQLDIASTCSHIVNDFLLLDGKKF